MSAQITEVGKDILPDARDHADVQDPVTQNLNNNHGTKATPADVRIDEERIPGMVREHTVWDVYNNEARKVDTELVKDWTASLNFLLVFAAIFAAVLTAFIIESKKMLEPDQTEILVNITIQYFNSIGNPSRSNITQPDFEPTSAAISINCCLFASLGASLVAALASVVSLQWVADYDAAITRGGSSPEDRAKRRQFRHAGVVGWRMGEIIASLPLLLYSSVILFWAGAILWMWTLHHIVGYVVAGGTAVAVFFYACTTLLGAFFVSSPFRTPLSRGLYWIPRWSISLLGRLIIGLKLAKFIDWLIFRYRLEYLSGGFDESRYARAAKWVRTHLLTQHTSRHREDVVAEQDPTFHQEALAWLSEQLPVSADSHNRLLLFAKGLVSLPEATPLSPRSISASWLAILEFLSAHYMQIILDPSKSVEDCEGLDYLLQHINHPCVRPNVVPGTKYEDNSEAGEYWDQYPGRDRFYRGQAWSADLAPMTFILARDVPVPSPGSKCELDAAFKLIRWRNSPRADDFSDINNIWTGVFVHFQHYSLGFSESCLWILGKRLSLAYRSGCGYETMEILQGAIEKAFSRDLTIQATLALAQAFADSVIWGKYRHVGDKINISFLVDRVSPIPQPLLYGHALELSGQGYLEIHHSITFLMARAAQSISRDERPHWTKCIVTMLWLGSRTGNNPSRILPKRGGGWRGMAYWTELDMTRDTMSFEMPHFEETLALLAALVEPQHGQGRIEDPIWINSTDENGKRSQIMRMLNMFSTMREGINKPALHRAAVLLIGRDICLSKITWPSAIAHPRRHGNFTNDSRDRRQELAHIQDPCLALMAAFTCGIPLYSKAISAEIYLPEHLQCLYTLREVVYRNISVGDSAALWELRAATETMDQCNIETYIGDPFSDPAALERLELLLQHPTQCHSHITSISHLILHLCWYAHKKGYQAKVLGSHYERHTWRTARSDANIILAMLAIADTQEFSYLTINKGTAECLERIFSVCKGLKEQPKQFIYLLRGVVTEPNRASHISSWYDRAAFIELLTQASALPEDAATAPLLGSLLLVLRGLLTQEWRRADPKLREKAESVCALLHARSTENLIFSNCHLQILSCARSAVAVRPAIGWLQMHVDL